MLHIICALKHEARPIIEHYRLVHDGGARLYTSYRNDNISLTITGIGKQAAAAGTQFTAEYFPVTESDAWLNIGIAGHKNLAIGTAVLASRVTDAADGSIWHPKIQFQTTLPALPLITLDQPSTSYPDNDMADMEAAGFFRSACRHAALDLIQSLKIISDNEAHPPAKISKQLVMDLVGANMVAIDKLVTQLRLCSEQSATTAP